MCVLTQAKMLRTRGFEESNRKYKGSCYGCVRDPAEVWVEDSSFGVPALAL